MDTFLKNIADSLKTANISVNAKLVVGVSGGMDSVALSHALKALNYDLVIAHLNHQLRGADADKDETFVIGLAKQWELPYFTQKAVIPKEGNLEANARQIRYSFLEDVREAYQADYIAVGHHFDDQIETILMHEKRGSGLRGKRGMSLIKGNIIRPMLDISRGEIEAYAHKHKLEYRHDKTNDDLDFERNHLRHKVIPKLKEDMNFEQTIRDKAETARRKLETLSEEKNEWLKTYLHGEYLDRHAFDELEKDLKVEILLHLLGQKDVYSKTLGRLIDFITHGRTGKELEVKGRLFIIEYDQIHYTTREAVKLKKTPLEGSIKWGGYHIHVSNIKSLYVRSWKTGDRFRPAGMKGRKKLQDFFTDSKIPRYQRKGIPILVDENDDIICIGNMRFAEEYKHLKEHISIDEK